jgi:hypothetical protein
VRGIRLLVAAALVLPTAVAGTSEADQIRLPTSDAAQLAATALLQKLPGFRPDRLLPSNVPGPVVNDEVVQVGVGGDGAVRRVVLDQRLRLTGTGDYAVRERGPARSATALGDEPPPVTRRGAVVWQGFSPGGRDLAARLVLDPLIEAVHLPLSVRVTYTGRDGVARPLEEGGRVPGPGTVTVSLRNDTRQPAELPTGTDVAATAVAPALDKALALARTPSAARLPDTDTGLPSVLQVSDAGQVAAAQAVPFRVTGALTLTGTTGRVSGPATTPTAQGARLAGTLGGVQGTPEVSFTVTADGPGALALDLTAVAAFDARALAPPRGFPSWRAWAAARPPQAERKAALDLLVEVAATGARASSYSPYLGAELTGSGSTTFRYAFAPAERPVAVKDALHPRWGAIALAGVALLLLLTNAGLIWRRL